MTLQQRMALALLILIVDLLLFIIPLWAILMAFVVLKRPPWFKAWVERLYA